MTLQKMYIPHLADKCSISLIYSADDGLQEASCSLIPKGSPQKYRKTILKYLDTGKQVLYADSFGQQAGCGHQWYSYIPIHHMNEWFGSLSASTSHMWDWSGSQRSFKTDCKTCRIVNRAVNSQKHTLASEKQDSDTILKMLNDEKMVHK